MQASLGKTPLWRVYWLSTVVAAQQVQWHQVLSLVLLIVVRFHSIKSRSTRKVQLEYSCKRMEQLQSSCMTLQ